MPGYEEQIGGYGTVRVSTLDSGTMRAFLVAAKTIRLKDRHKEPKRLAFVREIFLGYLQSSGLNPYLPLALGSGAQDLGGIPTPACPSPYGLLPR